MSADPGITLKPGVAGTGNLLIRIQRTDFQAEFVNFKNKEAGEDTDDLSFFPFGQTDDTQLSDSHSGNDNRV